MDSRPGYISHVDKIGRDAFIELFSGAEKPEEWFTENELRAFSFPRNAGSLAARYLIKRRICRQLGGYELKKEIEVLNEESGKPFLNLSQSIRAAMEKAGIHRILCSLSHSKNHIAGLTVFCFEEDV